MGFPHVRILRPSLRKLRGHLRRDRQQWARGRALEDPVRTDVDAMVDQAGETPLAHPSQRFETDRERHVRALADRLSGEVELVTWPLERLHARRDERLRAL